MVAKPKGFNQRHFKCHCDVSAITAIRQSPKGAINVVLQSKTASLCRLGLSGFCFLCHNEDILLYIAIHCQSLFSLPAHFLRYTLPRRCNLPFTVQLKWPGASGHFLFGHYFGHIEIDSLPCFTVKEFHLIANLLFNLHEGD